MIYIYILGKKDDSVDDRKAMTGGPGIIRYNMKKKEFEKVHYLDIPSEIFENDPKPTKESIATGIVKRQYVNEHDMLYFVELVYEGEREKYFNFGRVFYDYKRDREKIRAHFRIEEIRDKLKAFLEDLNVKCEVEDNGWLVITRVPEQS
ncbi:hypothetical protein KUL118_31270 [Tenacibaculum sp. KUL118]|nr:hypothetical protein KUL118_31270 [Tenacibaculum sp. KUL118]